MSDQRFNRWHLVQLTPEAAMEHDRRVHKCGPGVGLGWTPYNYRATRGAVAQWACHTDEQLAVKLRQHGLKIAKWTPWSEGGVRSTYLVECLILSQPSAQTMEHPPHKTRGMQTPPRQRKEG